MKFCPMILEQVERYKRFYAADKGGLMGIVSINNDFNNLPKRLSLKTMDWNDRGACRKYAQSNLHFLLQYWKDLPQINDDRIRSFQNLAGVGALGASFVKDAVVHLEDDTNYLDAPLKDWVNGTANIGFDPENKWFKAQMWMLEYYIENWDGSFGLSPFTHFDPLDLCNQWRGNDLFYDFYEYPEELKELLEKATNCVLELESCVRNDYMKDCPQEGSMFGGIWVPGNYLSCDAGDMCGSETLETYGTPYTSKIASAWGGAYLHHHELGIHQIKTWERCEGLTIQFLNRDPNTEHLAQSMSDEVIESSLKLPVQFIATYSEFVKNASRWAHGKFVVAIRCDDETQAHEVCKILNNHRNF